MNYIEKQMDLVTEDSGTQIMKDEQNSPLSPSYSSTSSTTSSISSRQSSSLYSSASSQSFESNSDISTSLSIPDNTISYPKGSLKYNIIYIFQWLCALTRPFRRIDSYNPYTWEMEYHPMLRNLKVTSRVAKYFIWRKWILILVLLLLFTNVIHDTYNFFHFYRDPYHSLCPVRIEDRLTKHYRELEEGKYAECNNTKAANKETGIPWNSSESSFDGISQLLERANNNHTTIHPQNNLTQMG